MSLVSELKTIADYNPTAYVNNSEPDLDAEHLNKTEQALKRVTDAANDAINALKELEKQKLSLNAIVQTESTATDKVPSSAYFKQVIDNINSNLSDKTNTSDFNNLKNSIVMVNVTGFAIGIDGNNVIIQWLTGENREFGYALNIGITDGTMQFFYRENGTWKPSWNK
nr:MAG TPA: hypothetical protein [Bacteriophage sp.]